MPGKRFIFKHRVYFNETNAMGGVVYYANYVKWQGIVREEFFLSTVPEWQEIMRQVAMGTANMITAEEYSHFIQHAFFGDDIEISIQAGDIKKYSFVINFEMRKNGASELVYTGWQRLAFDDFKGNFIPIPPPLLRSVLEHTPEDEYNKYIRKYSVREDELITKK